MFLFMFQVRRWKIWDTSEPIDTQPPVENTTKSKKSVNFLKTDNGDDWVWVMGEHEDDISIEEILAIEAKLKAKKLAEIETSELRKSFQAELTDFLEFDSIKSEDDDEMTSNTPKIEENEIYCSVDDLKYRISKSKISKQPYLKKQFETPQKDKVKCFNFTNTNDRKIQVKTLN